MGKPSTEKLKWLNDLENLLGGSSATPAGPAKAERLDSSALTNADSLGSQRGGAADADSSQLGAVFGADTVMAGPDEGAKPPPAGKSDELAKLEAEHRQAADEVKRLKAQRAMAKQERVVAKRAAAQLIQEAGGPTPPANSGGMFDPVEEERLLKAIINDPTKKAHAKEAESILAEVTQLERNRMGLEIAEDEAVERELDLRRGLAAARSKLKKGGGSGGQSGGSPQGSDTSPKTQKSPSGSSGDKPPAKTTVPSKSSPPKPAKTPTNTNPPPAPTVAKPPVKATDPTVSTPKTTKVAPKSTPTAPKGTSKIPSGAKTGGKVVPKSVPNPDANSRVYQRLKPALKKLEEQGKGFLSSAGRIAKTVKVPVSIALELLNAIDMIEMSESAATGNGFIFTAEIARAASLSRDVSAMVEAYKNTNVHQDLSDTVAAAKKIDAEDPEGLYGSDMLSNFCAQVQSSVSSHKDTAEELLGYLNSVESDVTARQNYANALLSSREFWITVATATQSSVIHAQLFAATQDMTRILGSVSTAKNGLDSHLKIVRGDLKVIEDNIIEHIQLGVTSVDD